MKAAYITVDAGESVNIEFSTNQAAFNLFAPIGKPITITPNA
jgi:hypothetical protein